MKYNHTTLRALRELHGFTQREICTAISIEHSTYSKWENNKFEPSLMYIAAMAKVFGMARHQLIDKLYSLDAEASPCFESIASNWVISFLESEYIFACDKYLRFPTFKNLDPCDRNYYSEEFTEEEYNQCRQVGYISRAASRKAFEDVLAKNRCASLFVNGQIVSDLLMECWNDLPREVRKGYAAETIQKLKSSAA